MVPSSAAWLSLLLVLRHGGLGLRSTTRHAPAAYTAWDSWADALHAIARRDSDFAHEVATSLASDRPPSLALQSARDASDSLSAIGSEPPCLGADLLHDPVPAQLEEDPSLDLTRGWQCPASQAVDDVCHRAFLRETNAPCCTCTLGLMLRVSSPRLPRWSHRASEPSCFFFFFFAHLFPTA